MSVTKEPRLKHRNIHSYVSANTSHVKLQKTSNFSIETLYRLRFGLMNDLGYCKAYFIEFP